MNRLNLTYFVKGIAASNFSAEGIFVSSAGYYNKIFFHGLPEVKI